MIEFFIAKKHILHRKKQSFISILGVMIGVTVLIVSLAISNGLDKNMINSILSLNSHIELRGNLTENLKEDLYKIDGIKAVIPSYDTQSIIKFLNKYDDTYTSGVKVLGLDYNEVLNADEITSKIIEGDIDLDDRSTILIGNELSKQFGISIGDTVTMVSSQNVDIDLTVTGIFQSGFYDYDANMVILPFFTAKYIDYFDDYAGKFLIKLNEPYNAEKISKIIREKYNDIYTITWGEQNKSLLSALNLEKTIMVIVISLIVVIAAFLVWIILNTLVREKIKDIGILRAMGFFKKNIMNIFLIQGLLFGIIGIVMGLILSFVILFLLKNYGISFLRNIYYLDKIPMEISLKEIFIISFANILLIFISSIFPAYRAAKMKNVEALIYD